MADPPNSQSLILITTILNYMVFTSPIWGHLFAPLIWGSGDAAAWRFLSITYILIIAGAIVSILATALVVILRAKWTTVLGNIIPLLLICGSVVLNQIGRG